MGSTARLGLSARFNCEWSKLLSVAAAGLNLRAALALLGWASSEPLSRGLAGMRCSAGRASVFSTHTHECVQHSPTQSFSVLA